MRALTICPERPSDYQAIAHVTRLAFDQTDGAEVQMIERIRASADFVPDLSLVALLEREGSDRERQQAEVVGHALFSYVQLKGARPARVLSLGPVSVWPAVQRRGIGTALIERGLSVARERGEPLVVVLGHPEYYPRFGFVQAAHFGLSPAWEALMICPLQSDLSDFRELQIPH